MRISVVGTGYVGLVSGVCLADVGHDVICIDKDIDKVKSLREGKIPIYEPGLSQLCKKNVRDKRLRFSSSLEEGVDSSDVIFIAVGTPSKDNGEADLLAVEKVATEIASIMKSYKVIVSKSTVPVTTGTKIFETIKLYNKNKIEFDVVSNPEFLREGSAIADFMNPDRIVLGVATSQAAKVMIEVYDPIDAPTLVTDIKSAELIKHASNSFLALKISYANALSNICEAVGADVKEVTQGMGYDKRIGKAFLDAGVGFGGSCFPKDLSAFIEIAKEAGYDFKLLKEVKDINKIQKETFFKKIKDALWNLKGKKITVLGLAFKPDTDDIREAPAIDIINKLLEEGADVYAYDHAATENTKKIFGDKIKYCKDLYEGAKESNAIVIMTEWEEFKDLDLKKLKALLATPIIIDGRNILDGEKVRELGFVYKGVGV